MVVVPSRQMRQMIVAFALVELAVLLGVIILDHVR
jgi:hypothetical protein